MLRNFLPKSLLGRTILIVLFPIIAFQIILLTYYYNSLWERTLNRLSRSVSMEINMIYDNFKTEQVDETQTKKFYDYYLIDVYLNDNPDFIEKENIKLLFEENDITLIRADWTKPDRNIDIFLKKFNKFGIPFNAFFSSKFSEGIILSELLTEKEIYESIEKLK